MAPLRAAPLASSFASVAAATVAAFLVGIAVGSTADSAIAGSVAAAAVIVATFAWRPVEGLIAVGMATLFADTVEHWSGASLRFLDEALIPALLVTAMVVHRARLHPLPRGWRELALGILVLAGVASSVVKAVPLDVWGPALLLLLKGVAIFYLVAAMRFDRDDLARFCGVTLGVGLVIAAIGLAEFVAPTAVQEALRLPVRDQQRGEITVVRSVFLHPALYGWLTAFLSLYLYARFAIARDRWSLPAALLLNVGTLLSGRRTPLIGIVAGLGTATVRQLAGGRIPLRTWAPVAVGVIVIGIISLSAMGGFYRQTFSEYVAPPEMVREIFAPEPDAEVLRQMQPRVALYLGSAAVARDEVPLGAGLGRFGSHMSREVYSPVYAEYGMELMYGIKPERPIAVTDTFWPMILGETGLLGLLAALAFFGLIGRELWRLARPGGPAALRVFAVGTLMIYAEALVRSLTSPVFAAPPIAYIVLGAVGLAISTGRMASEGLFERRGAGAA
jgi:hypothetical protein